MEFITTYRPYAEFAYFLSWPLLLATVIVALLQIKAFKEEARTRFKREIIAASISVLESKLLSIANHYERAHNDECESTPPDFKGDIVDVKYSTSFFDSEWLEWYENHSEAKFRNSINSTINEIEILANYIYSGITDEELCYKLERHSILGYIQDLLPYIAFARTDDRLVVYENTVKLYIDWSNKVEHDKSQNQLKAIEEQLQKQKRPDSVKSIC
ncbi:hypothetical protein D3C77_444790 [compost metagenome]